VSESAEHRRWLASETDRLLLAAQASRHPDGGFAWLDSACQPMLDRPIETWITARMTHVLSVGLLLGHRDCAELVDHGINALQTLLRDPTNNGWFSSTDPVLANQKRAYDQCFVMLAASSALVAGRPGARALLDDAIAVFDNHFWDEDHGWIIDGWNGNWSQADDYLGANANMHGVEMCLAVADATGDDRWLHRATRIANWFIGRHARQSEWRVPEHFSAAGTPDLSYNEDKPADPFRPFGSTVGHGFEWARLLIDLDAAFDLAAPASSSRPGWLTSSAKAIFARAALDGWSVDDAPGFVYTVDWAGTPVVRDRLHWVAAEAIAAAGALWDFTGDDLYGERYDTWWAYTQQHFVDTAHGSWIHQLDERNRPSSSVWAGKPDVYHAFQACLLPRLPAAPSLATAVAAGELL
jgi:sulfoquinovose isomerase